MYHLKSLAMTLFFVLVLLSAAPGANSKTEIVQSDGLKYIQVGEEFSLNCTFSSHDTSTTAWLRQALGEKPLKIAAAYYTTEVIYEKTGRFSILKRGNSFILNVSNAELSDSATYFCAVTYYMDIDLDSCTVVVLEGLHAGHNSYIHQPVLDPVFQGDNINLQCIILTESCAGEHSVYWFRHMSEESHPGIIYTHGGRSNQCNKRSESSSSTQSCVYNLPKNNLEISNAGTYYCAVAMCGEILFGNGTTLQIKDEDCTNQMIILVWLSILRGGGIVGILATFIFLHCAYKMKYKC